MALEVFGKEHMGVKSIVSNGTVFDANTNYVKG